MIQPHKIRSVFEVFYEHFTVGVRGVFNKINIYNLLNIVLL